MSRHRVTLVIRESVAGVSLLRDVDFLQPLRIDKQVLRPQSLVCGGFRAIAAWGKGVPLSSPFGRHRAKPPGKFERSDYAYRS